MVEKADYLVIGAGAMGMAFTDVLVTETDASICLVDRYHQPGGHWTVAYPFVRLHQPSSFYGVNSRKLGDDTIDATGWNRGLYELATSGEVCAYYEQVLHQHFLPSGRVRYFPMHEYEGEGRFVSRLSGKETRCEAAKIVDATYMNVQVPAMRPPPFAVDQRATCVAPNQLPHLSHRAERYTVVGAGKTGLDACLFLIASGVEPSRMSWIVPRDSWLLNRAKFQGEALHDESIGRTFPDVLRAIAGAESIDHAFERLQATGILLRLDDSSRPTMYRCATVTRSELAEIRRIREVVRLGRVKRIGADTIELEHGHVSTTPETVHVDCTADGLAQREPVPVFAGDRITLQSVRTCQQVFSAALIAHIETRGLDDAEKNELATPVPHPDSDVDFLRNTLMDLANGARWAADADLQAWLRQSRLDFSLRPGDAEPDPEAAAGMARDAARALETLQHLVASTDRGNFFEVATS